MSSEMQLDIAYVSVTPRKDGSDDRVEFINITDFGLYERTEGKELEYAGGSEEFINYAGCNKCPVKDTLCKPDQLKEYKVPTLGRKVSFNTDKYLYEEFPCHVRWDEQDT